MGAWQNICILCGHWSPGESCFICLKYCVLASCLTSKAPETNCTSLRLLIQQFPVIFLWPSHFWCSSFEERRNRYQAIQSCRTVLIPKKPLLIITPHKHQTNQSQLLHFQQPIVMNFSTPVDNLQASSEHHGSGDGLTMIATAASACDAAEINPSAPATAKS